ncbi:MAG: MazG-like family protein [Bacillota bacterium]
MPSDDQERVSRLVMAYGLEAPVAERLLDLLSELGEAAKEVLRGSSYGRQQLQLGCNWSGELGDLYFSLLCLANSTGVDLSASLTGAMAKYEARIAGRGSPDSKGSRQSRHP